VVGFGADTVERVEGYAEEPGAPDLLIRDRASGKDRCVIDVTGTYQKPVDLWVAAYKIAWAEEHPDLPWFVAMMFDDRKTPVIVKPGDDAADLLQTVYPRSKAEIMAVFKPGHPSIWKAKQFAKWLREQQ
ncbi:MAG: hypothetical protein KGR26_10755, partial [Cyanobacteria bacterium REEB65]|nr:hypothetical protein [Cyanobacteria bacterium REEB65]